MNLSPNGLRLIKSFEGYHKRLSDGRCVAYLCPADVWTIGYGCTEGVHPGMVWTEAQAEAGLASEISRFEAAVERLVKVPLNQNEYDALVSFAYNCGEGALKKSTILKRLNRGDRTGAASAFDAWNKGGGRVLPGLVARRKREASLFLKPMDAPEAPAMPQAVSAPTPIKDAVVGASKVAVPTGVVVGTGTQVAPTLPVPQPPAAITDSITNLELWKTVGESTWMLKTWAVSSPMLAGALGVTLMTIWFWPKKKDVA